MAPRQKGLTWIPVRPNVRYCMNDLLEAVGVPYGGEKRNNAPGISGTMFRYDRRYGTLFRKASG
jgi:hypothetical protein